MTLHPPRVRLAAAIIALRATNTKGEVPAPAE
jgi:hypothetical protein